MRHSLPLLAICALLTACAAIREAPQVIIRDSLVIRERIVHDTVLVQLPAEQQQNTTRDTVSHLETTYAASDASVTDGVLRHSLESKPQVITVPVERTVHDTVHIKGETIRETVTVEIERPLTRWQEVLLGLGKGALVATIMTLLIGVAALIRKFL